MLEADRLGERSGTCRYFYFSHDEEVNDERITVEIRL